MKYEHWNFHVNFLVRFFTKYFFKTRVTILYIFETSAYALLHVKIFPVQYNLNINVYSI